MMMFKDILAFMFGGSMGFLIIQLLMVRSYFNAGIAAVAYLSILVRSMI